MAMKMSFRERLKKLENFLFMPHTCIVCGRECDDTLLYRICENCKKKIDFTGKNYCLICGERINEGYDYCANCDKTKYNFDYARSVFAYDDETRKIIMTFKYNGKKTLKYPLGKLLADYYQDSDIVADIVTSVPMPKKREKQRGYNQACELAKEFCKNTNMEYVDLLTRVKDSKKQADLTAKERAENIKGSFCAINKAQIKNRDILLIDDVLTTGATASECARVLKKEGARSVAVLTLAKTRSNLIKFEQ